MSLQRTKKKIPTLNTTTTSVKSEDTIPRQVKTRQSKHEVLPSDRFSVLACIASEELKSVGISIDGWRTWKGTHGHNKSKLFSTGTSTKCLKKFSTPLEEFEVTLPYEINSGGKSICVRIPDFMAECLEYLENCLTTVGLFRIAGSASRIKSMQAKVDSGISLEQLNPRPHDVACLLKTFLSCLATPLIPEYASNIFWLALNLQEALVLKSVLITVFLLPAMHIYCLQALLSFLGKVIANEKYNKMSLDSLAIILAPSLFHKQSCKRVSQSQIQNGISTLETLLHNSEKVGIESFCFNFQPSFLMNSVCQNDKKNRRRKGSLTDLFRLRRRKEDISISSPYNFNTPNSRPINSVRTISPKSDCPIKGRSLRKRVLEGETQNNKKIRELTLSPENIKISVNSLVKKKLERRNAFKKHTKESEKKPFAFTSDAISLEDVKLNIDFNDPKPDNLICYVFAAPPPSPKSDTSPLDTSATKYEMPLSASEESLVNFANSLATEECASMCDYEFEDPLSKETAGLLSNQIGSSRDYIQASTPISPETINRTHKVTFDSKPATIFDNKLNKPDILPKDRTYTPQKITRQNKTQLNCFNFTPSCFQITPRNVAVSGCQGKDVTFTDSETPATFHRGVTFRKSFKKFAKPFQVKKLERLSSEKDSSDTESSPILETAVRENWRFRKSVPSSLLPASKLDLHYDSTPECKRKCKHESPEVINNLVSQTNKLCINNNKPTADTSNNQSYSAPHPTDLDLSIDCLPSLENLDRRQNLPDLLKHTTRRHKRATSRHRTPSKPPIARPNSRSSNPPVCFVNKNASKDSNSSYESLKGSPGILPWRSAVTLIEVSPVEKISKAKSVVNMDTHAHSIETEKLPSVASSVKLFENLCKFTRSSEKKSENKFKKILKRNSLKSSKSDDSQNSPHRSGLRKCLSFKLLSSLNYD